MGFTCLDTWCLAIPEKQTKFSPRFLFVYTTATWTAKKVSNRKTNLDKLRNLFLVDSKIKLKEVDKIYTIDNINDFIRDISLFLKDEQKCSEENNQDIKQSLQVEQSIALEQENDSEYNVYRTWWGKTFAIFVVVWLISMFTSHDWGTKDFSKKYSLRYSVSYSEVERVVGYDTPMFPIPYKRYKIEYNDGSEKTIGYKVLGLIFITDEI